MIGPLFFACFASSVFRLFFLFGFDQGLNHPLRGMSPARATASLLWLFLSTHLCPGPLLSRSATLIRKNITVIPYLSSFFQVVSGFPVADKKFLKLYSWYFQFFAIFLPRKFQTCLVLDCYSHLQNSEKLFSFLQSFNFLAKYFEACLVMTALENDVVSFSVFSYYFYKEAQKLLYIFLILCPTFKTTVKCVEK